MGLLPNALESIDAGDTLAPCSAIDEHGMIGGSDANGRHGIAPCVVASSICATRRLSVPSRTAAQAAHVTPPGELACRFHIVGCSAGRANDQHRRIDSGSPSLRA